MGKDYQLRVTAGNLYGYGSPSTPVAVKLDEETFNKTKATELGSAGRGKKINVDDYDKFCEFSTWWILILGCFIFPFIYSLRHKQL